MARMPTMSSAVMLPWTLALTRVSGSWQDPPNRRRGDERDQEGEYAANIEEYVLAEVHPAQCEHAHAKADECRDEHGPGRCVEVGADGAEAAIRLDSLIDDGCPKGHQQPNDPDSQVTIGPDLVADISPDPGRRLASRAVGHSFTALSAHTRLRIYSEGNTVS